MLLKEILRLRLKEPMTIVITETLAKKLFGSEKRIGKIIKAK